MRTAITRSIVFIVFSSVLLLSFGEGHKTMARPYVYPDMEGFPPMPVSASDPVTIEGAALGRYLFYDPILSRDSTMSCSSCHRQERAFSDAPAAFSTGSSHQPMARNTPALFNLAWHPALFSDGRAASIEEQVLHPVRSAGEMNLSWAEAAENIRASDFYSSRFRSLFGSKEIDSTMISGVIGQFLRTLVSYRSKYDMVTRGEAQYTKDEYEGFLLVNDQTRGDCQHCHVTDGDRRGSTYGYSNNGLDDVSDATLYRDRGHGAVSGRVEDYGTFKIPSLRNVALTAPYMHDGRYTSLQQVIDFYSDSVHACANIDSKMGSARYGGVHLSRDEKRKVLAFLYTLTDSAFIREPAFSNPFAHHQ